MEGVCGDLIWDNSTYFIGSRSNESIHVKPLQQCPAHNKCDVSVNLKSGNVPSKFVKEDNEYLRSFHKRKCCIKGHSS